MSEYQDKTKEELIEELKKLHLECDTLRSSGENDRISLIMLEKNLHQSEKQYRNLAENTSLIIARLDRSFRHLYVNPAAFLITGIKPEEYIGKTHRELGFPSEQCDFWEASIEKVFTTGKSVHESVVFDAIYGEMFLDWRLYPEFDASGEVTSVLSNVHDITELKKAEEKLTQALEWQDAIFEGSRDAIFISDRDSRFVVVNNAACDLTGHSREQLLNMRIPDIHDRQDLDAYNQFHKRIFAGEEILSEAKILRSDGTKIDTEFNNKCVSIAGTQYMHTTARNITARKQAEQTILESERRHQFLFNNLLNGLAYCQMLFDDSGNPVDFIYLEVNDAFGRLTGLKKVIGKKVTEVIPGIRQTDGELLNIFGRVARTRTPESCELKVISLNDWFSVSVYSPLKDHFVAIFDLITNRKNTEEKLCASEAEYRSLFENSIIGISQSKPGGGLYRINHAYASLYGYPDITTMLKELSGDTKILFSNPDDRKKVIEDLKKNGSIGPSEFELKRRNGEKFWALVGAREVRDSNGELLYLQAEHIDITGQKKLEKERYLSSQYARNLIEASLDPFVTISADGKIMDVNKSTEQITGLKRDKLIGTDFADYFSDPVKARKGYKIVFSKGVVKDYPLTILHSGGRKMDVLYNASLFKNEEGEVQGVFAVARDITEREKMESELRKSKKLLEKLHHHVIEIRENERSQIALNLHDDIGQKLTALNLNLTWIKSRLGVQSKVVKKKLEEMTLMINETITGVQNFSSNLRPAILFDLGLVAAFDSFLNLFEKQSGVKCHFYHEKTEIKTEDKISLILYRILQESMTNIARHSEATLAEVTLRKVRNSIEMLIKDNGIGIDVEKVNSMKSMGIAGIKERVRSTGGTVMIKGEKGSWTFIKVSIPV